MSKKANFIFIKDKVNKFSIRALIVAFEKFFPDLEYRVIAEESLTNEYLDSGLVFLSFNSISYPKYFDLALQLKKNYKDIVLVCGGAHPSARPEQMLNVFDCVCVGEGEYVLKEIIENYLSNTLESGIYKSDENVDLNEFDAYPQKMYMFGAIEIMRGCQYRCQYCQTPNLFPGKPRFRNIESILENVRYAYKQGKKDFRFISPDAASYMYDKGVNIDAIHMLLLSIKKVTENNGRIFFGSFPSEINPYFVTEDLLLLMKEFCYNKKVVIGLQTASVAQLKKINRPSNISRVEQSIELFLKYNFTVDVDFIFGLPFENEETLQETVNWIKRWQDKVRIHAHYFMPLPGSNWEYMSPTDIPDEFIKVIKQLEGKGRIYGQWCTQTKISNEIKAFV